MGEGLAGKSSTQPATKVAAGGFSVDGGCDCTIELGTNLLLFFN
jgi:hypothetical protein